MARPKRSMANLFAVEPEPEVQPEPAQAVEAVEKPAVTEKPAPRILRTVEDQPKPKRASKKVQQPAVEEEQPVKRKRGPKPTWNPDVDGKVVSLNVKIPESTYDLLTDTARENRTLNQVFVNEAIKHYVASGEWKNLRKK